MNVGLIFTDASGDGGALLAHEMQYASLTGPNFSCEIF